METGCNNCDNFAQISKRKRLEQQTENTHRQGWHMSKTNNFYREPTFNVGNTLNTRNLHLIEHSCITTMFGATNVDHFRQGTRITKCCQSQFDDFRFLVNDSMI